MLNRPRVHQNIVTQEGMTRTHICSISNKFNNLNMKKCGIFFNDTTFYNAGQGENISNY